MGVAWIWGVYWFQELNLIYSESRVGYRVLGTYAEYLGAWSDLSEIIECYRR